MKLANKLITASLMLAISAPLLAQDTTDLQVSGKVVPTACTPTLSNGGVVDYGTLGMGELLDSGYALLPQKTIDLAITCDGEAKVAISAVNWRTNSAVSLNNDDKYGRDYANAPNGVKLFGGTGWRVAGLGLNNGTERIGGYSIRLHSGSTLLDGAPGIYLGRNYSTGSWSSSSDGLMFGLYREVTWTKDAAVKQPSSFKTLSAVIDVQAYLNKASALTQTQEIKLNGALSLEMVYL